ncbi:MAG TPA: sigma 54-interacting transcriptional regulator [Terriglobales bacterium]|nr:sigma 54-interacting transcriptional regulator [Terriglobales bacterium]
MAAHISTPPQLHLLHDQEMEQLQPLLKTIVRLRGEVVRQWYRLYLAHLGDSRSLSEAEFVRIFEPALEQAKSALINRDREEYARRIISLGRSLAEKHRLPLEEAIIAFQMFEQSAHFVAQGETPWCKANFHSAFAKLSCLRTRLLVTGYLTSDTATTSAQLAAVDRAAALLAAATTRFCGLIGASEAMRRLYRNIEEQATAANPFIVGERGTGRESVARALHQRSARAARPFLAINCAAVAPQLIEDELFGYPPTPDHGGCLGLLRCADGGTLFIDQIEKVPATTQKKLARALAERVIPANIAEAGTAIDVRLIAASSLQPHIAAADGNLQVELLHTLHAPALVVPPLRQCREDIPLLTEHFIAVFNHRLHRRIAGVERDAMEAMSDYPWPGNVQELRNAIEYAFDSGAHPVIGLEDLPNAIGGAPRGENNSRRAAAYGSSVTSFAQAERELIARALESTGGNKVRAANLLQISRKKLYAKIEKYSIK